MMRTAATPELELLKKFVGIWDTEGHVMSDPSGERIKFKGTDTYEWLPGGYFLLHRYEAIMPQGNITGIEIIGYNRESDTYSMYSFDSQGNADVMEGRFEMDNWTFIGGSALFSGGFGDGGKVFTGLWEKRSGKGADWQPWMEVSLNKVE